MKRATQQDVMNDIMGITIDTGDAFLNKKLNGHICYKGGGGSSTTVNEGVPAEFKPYFTRALQRAEEGYTSGDLAYVADATPETQQAQNMARQAAARQTGLAGQSISGVGTLGQAAAGTGGFGRQTVSSVDPSLTAAQDVSGAYGDAIEQAQQALAQERVGSSARGTMGSARSQLRQGNVEANLARQMGSAQLAENIRAQQAALGEAQSVRSQDLAEGARFQGQRLGAAGGQISGAGAAQGQQVAGAQTMQQVGKEIQDQAQREGDSAYQALQRYSQVIGASAPSLGSSSTTTQSGGK